MGRRINFSENTIIFFPSKKKFGPAAAYCSGALITFTGAWG